VAFIFNAAEAGPSTLIRCELDALPIVEVNQFAHRSKRHGVSHKCGHDGHMAIVTSLGEKLARHRPSSGRVILLFQPAEETGAGAQQVVKDSQFEQIQPDYAFALHNLPGQPLAQVGVKSGSFNCASRGLSIKLIGKTSHAAHPEDGNSPALVISHLIQQLPQLAEKLNGFALITVIAASLGAEGEPAFGTSPGEAKLMLTLRSETDQQMNLLVESVSQVVGLHTAEFGLSFDLSWHDVFHACSNTDKGYQKVVAACDELGVEYTRLQQAYRWSEDFGQLRNAAAEGAMFTLGSGINSPQLHNPDYDFPDQLIPVGRDLFFEIIRSINGIN